MSRRIVIDELEFEVPYGKIAAKTWYEETDDSKRILALHGWMDNLGTFDSIIPDLKYDGDMYIVALDLPGHGKSSQLPPGSSYTDVHIVMEIRRCLTELKWIKPVEETNGNSQHKSHKKFSIIGHSLGAGLGLFYCSLFPDEVEEIITIDFLKSKTLSTELELDEIASNIDKFLSTVPGQSPSNAKELKPGVRNPDKGQVVVSQETAIIATIEAHKTMGTLSRAEAATLLKRSTVAISAPPNSVIYFRDLRLQSILSIREHLSLNMLIFGRVKCRILAILAKRGLYDQTEGPFIDGLETMKELFKSNSKSFHCQYIDGDHCLPINRPKQCAQVINKYFSSPADFTALENM